MTGNVAGGFSLTPVDDPCRPSALDAIVGAHVLLLLEPSYPMPVIKHLLVESYPSLVAHARLLFSQTLSASAPAISKAPSQVITWRDILPSMPWFGKRSVKTEDEIRYSKLRWGFFGLVAGCMATYIAIVGRGVKIRIVRAGDVGDEEIEEEMDEDYEEGEVGEEEEEEEEESM
jgi:sorting and assembly machinery component 37